MNHLVIIDATTRYERITKQQARKRFAAGESFYIIAHKMRPGMPFSMGMTIDSKHCQEENQTFDQMLASFCYYNANCHETGTYAAYYLELPGWEKA